MEQLEKLLMGTFCLCEQGCKWAELELGNLTALMLPDTEGARKKANITLLFLIQTNFGLGFNTLALICKEIGKQTPPIYLFFCTESSAMLEPLHRLQHLSHNIQNSPKVFRD